MMAFPSRGWMADVRETAWAEKGIVGRGVLVDYHSWRLRQGEACYEAFDAFTTTPIPLSDLKACLAEQGTSVKFGDILLVRSGKGSLRHSTHWNTHSRFQVGWSPMRPSRRTSLLFCRASCRMSWLAWSKVKRCFVGFGTTSLRLLATNRAWNAGPRKRTGLYMRFSWRDGVAPLASSSTWRSWPRNAHRRRGGRSSLPVSPVTSRVAWRALPISLLYSEWETPGPGRIRFLAPGLEW